MNIYYPLDSHGYTQASLSEIRIDCLNDRMVPNVLLPHKHAFFQIIILEKGNGSHVIDFNKHQIKGNQLYILKPGQVHQCVLEKELKGYVIEFKRESLDVNVPISSSLINQLMIAENVFELSNNEVKNLLTICQEMHRDFKEAQDFYDISLQGYLTGLLVQIVRIVGKGTQQFLPQSLSEKFIDLVNTHYKKEHAVEFYARKLGVTSKTLIAHLNRTHRKAPRLMIQERFILEAKRLLSYSDLTVAEIGYEVGFDDPNYFSRFFRKCENMTPLEFQKKLKKI